MGNLEANLLGVSGGLVHVADRAERLAVAVPDVNAVYVEDDDLSMWRYDEVAAGWRPLSGSPLEIVADGEAVLYSPVRSQIVDGASVTMPAHLENAEVLIEVPPAGSVTIDSGIGTVANPSSLDWSVMAWKSIGGAWVPFSTGQNLIPAGQNDTFLHRNSTTGEMEWVRLRADDRGEYVDEIEAEADPNNADPLQTWFFLNTTTNTIWVRNTGPVPASNTQWQDTGSTLAPGLLVADINAGADTTDRQVSAKTLSDWRAQYHGRVADTAELLALDDLINQEVWKEDGGPNRNGAFYQQIAAKTGTTSAWSGPYGWISTQPKMNNTDSMNTSDAMNTSL